MQVVIEIDDKLYNRIKYLEPKSNTMLDELMRNVQSGTPLPKGHGRLIDADKLQDYFDDNRSKLFQSKDCIIGIDNALTIIEADKEE